MVYIPDDYDPEITYPLVIYLHGSASDETNIMSKSLKRIIGSLSCMVISITPCLEERSGVKCSMYPSTFFKENVIPGN